MVKGVVLAFAMLILLASCSSALDVETYSATFNLVKDKAVVEVIIVFNETTTDVFEFDLPDDYEALSVYIDGKPIPVDIKNSALKLELNETSIIRFNYITEEFVDKTNFLMNMELDFDVSELLIKLILPEGASLKTPIQEGDLTSGSIYPKPSKSTTDGRSLIFYWLRKDMKQGDEISIFTLIEPRKDPFWWIVLLVIVIILSIGAYISLLKRKPKPEVIVTKPKTKVIVRKEDMVEKHLKEDEEQIVNILKSKEGSCEQGTIRVISGFSKATLSRLLKELEDRKIIYKEQRGKKNVVFLKK